MTMRRRFRARRRFGGARSNRSLFWLQGETDYFQLVAGASQFFNLSVDLLTGPSPDEQDFSTLVGTTITRTILSGQMIIGNTTDPNECWGGMGLLLHGTADLSGTSLPNPVDDDVDWYWRTVNGLKVEPTIFSPEMNALTGYHKFNVDIRAQRKFTELDQRWLLVFSNSAGSTGNIWFQASILHLLRRP